jgi:hypothetical protein
MMGLAEGEAALERVREICWIKTRAWMEMLNVDLCVIRKRVLRCALILKRNNSCQVS